MKHIVNILTSTHSSYVRQFLILTEEIDNGMKDAKSNVDFLRLLQKPCADLNECTHPREIAQHLPKILHLFRVVWLNSPFYNNSEKMINLFAALSNQIIVVCQSFIDFEDIFQGNTRRNMNLFRECIGACKDYMRLYEKV